MFAQQRRIRIDAEARPKLLVVVDTEEEFDWGRFDRGATTVRAMRDIHRFQSLCDEFSVRPTYVVDYPVATQSDGIDALKEAFDEGRATVGAHLHPWVNPPHEEELTHRNTYAGNLGRDLETSKLRTLADAIEAGFGTRPRIYKAGRYGLGPDSAAILEQEGFEVDLSVCPPLDLRAGEGPDYSRCTTDPFWFGKHRDLLEIPVTGAYVGWLRSAAPALHELVTKSWLRHVRLGGALARLRALERMRLSPEGMSPGDNRRLTRALLRRGCRVFTYSLHSPSLAIGHTPYVRDERERDSFLASCSDYLEYFLSELQGECVTPLELKSSLEAAAGERRPMGIR